MRCCKRSFSCTRASPTITRVMPWLRSPNCNSMAMMRAAFWAPSPSRSMIWFTRPNTVWSMKSSRPSNIWALLAKWRYSAASLTCNLAARAAVVTRSPPGCSSIWARVCKICTRRSPGLGRLRVGASSAAGEGRVSSSAMVVSLRCGGCWVRSVRANHGAVGLVGQNFQQHGVGHTAIDDVHRVHAALGGLQRTADLGQHAAADGAVFEQVVNLTR